jgi:hypothetical protein
MLDLVKAPNPHLAWTAQSFTHAVQILKQRGVPWGQVSEEKADGLGRLLAADTAHSPGVNAVT